MTGRIFGIKSLVIICVISIICYILIGLLFYRRGSQIVIAQAKNETMRIAQTAASEIDGDVFVTIENEDSPGFGYVYDKLSKYRDGEGLDFIYSMKKIKEGELVFVVDTDVEEPAEVFEPYEWLDSMAPAFNGTVCADEDFNTDEWGTFLSGYAPIYDSQNTVVGIVGCDMNINTINERLVRLRILILMLWVISNAIMVPMLGSKDQDGSQ